MSKTERSLSNMETTARSALAGRGALYISYGWSDHGSTALHTTGMSLADAHALATSLPYFRVTETVRTESGAAAFGYLSFAK